jgi:DNA-binding winged helix-turn-helix (wHTH) protein
MEHVAASGTVFHFGLFEANPIDGVLRRSGTKVKIQDQPFRLLLLLLERPGEVVSREELRQRLWPEGTYVDFDGSLNVILKSSARRLTTIPRTRGLLRRFHVAVTGLLRRFRSLKKA